MICLFDTRTNVATLCHAGDNKVHLYEAEKRETIQTVLNEAPATGMFPRFMFADKTPYREVPQRLDPGDALFLFTDGFEESNRALRTEDFQLIYQEEEARPGAESDGRKRKPESEEFGIPRIHGVSDAVFNRSAFRLERAKNPIPGEELAFDFSGCAGTAKEAVLALVAVEKVFRLIRHPQAGAQNKVKVDQQVDGFLKKYFRQYPAYFSHPLEAKPGEQSIEFTHLMEDEQFDDLTLLVMRRK
jgi:hypothetical protein